jgi:hypothetical protein
MNVARCCLDAVRCGLVLLVLVGLGVPGATAQPFDRSRLTVESAAGAFEFEVELALTPAQRQRGLMYREQLAANAGMLFDFGRIGPVSMWMRNTYIPLDMLFLRANGEIVTIARNTEPRSDAIISADEPVRAVLELPGGTSDRLGLRPGDRVRHPLLAE